MTVTVEASMFQTSLTGRASCQCGLEMTALLPLLQGSSRWCAAVPHAATRNGNVADRYNTCRGGAARP